MYLMKAKYDILKLDAQEDICKFLELCGRTCYKSEERITDDSAIGFVASLLNKKPIPHESVLEHYGFTVRFTTDRGVSHELVRHRIAAYSQESTRFCDYGKNGVAYIIPPKIYEDCDLQDGLYCINQDTFRQRITMIDPNTNVKVHIDVPHAVSAWVRNLSLNEMAYNEMRDLGWKPEEARGMLAHYVKTEVVATYNLHMWRHVLRTRTMDKCHPQMKELTRPLLYELKCRLPVFFSDIDY
jgi:thymidylate synthase (FAD)